MKRLMPSMFIVSITILHASIEHTQALNRTIHYFCTYERDKNGLSVMQCAHQKICTPTREHLLANLLCSAIRKDYPETAEYICAHEPSCVNATNCWGETPLHIAASKGNDAIVMALLRSGADPNKPSLWYDIYVHPYSRSFDEVPLKSDDYTHNDGYSYPLIAAAYGGHATTVLLLLSHGAQANVSCTGPFARQHQGPLMGALFGYCWRARCTNERHIQAPFEDIIELLIRHKADVNEGKYYRSPFYLSVSYCLTKSARLIVKHPQLDVRGESLYSIASDMYSFFNDTPWSAHDRAAYNRNLKSMQQSYELIRSRTFPAATLTEVMFRLWRTQPDVKEITFFEDLLRPHGKLGDALYKRQSLLGKIVKAKDIEWLKRVLSWGVNPNVHIRGKKYPLDYLGSLPNHSCFYYCSQRCQKKMYEEKCQRKALERALHWHGAFKCASNTTAQWIIPELVKIKIPFLTFLAAIKKDRECARRPMRKKLCIDPTLPPVPELPHELIVLIYDYVMGKKMQMAAFSSPK